MDQALSNKNAEESDEDIRDDEATIEEKLLYGLFTSRPNILIQRAKKYQRELRGQCTPVVSPEAQSLFSIINPQLLEKPKGRMNERKSSKLSNHLDDKSFMFAPVPCDFEDSVSSSLQNSLPSNKGQSHQIERTILERGREDPKKVDP